MPTRNVSLTPEQDAFIDQILRAGEYRNASEAIRDAIRALQQRRAEEALKLDKLRLSIKQGVAELDRGAYTEVEEEDLDAYLDDLAALPEPGWPGRRYNSRPLRKSLASAIAWPQESPSTGRRP